MFSTDDITLDCSTCLAANTTACGDCVVSHLLANDDGPIELEPVRVDSPTVVAAAGRRDATSERGRSSGSSETPEVERAIGLFARAGLIDDDVEFVSQGDFDAGRIPSLA